MERRLKTTMSTLDTKEDGAFTVDQFFFYENVFGRVVSVDERDADTNAVVQLVVRHVLKSMV